jgi:Ca2+-binding EF-hand superfamily protein
MGRLKIVKPVLSPKEIRAEVRNYITQERDTVIKKWLALQEAVKLEDYRRDLYYKERLEKDTKMVPLTVRKFIGSLKKSVRKTMRDKGGTAYSIIRHMFIYWDTDKSGDISSNELQMITNSLGIKISLKDIDEVIAYYDNGKNQNEMSYHELLKDIERGEPKMTEFIDESKNHNEDISLRYEDRDDLKSRVKPTIVEQFLEATRNYIAIKMRNEGSTPFAHVRHLFNMYDYDYSNGLNASELRRAANKGMKMCMTPEQANQILEYYDTYKTGDINYDDFLKDVCIGVKPILSYTEVSTEEVQKAKYSLSINPLLPKPFKAPPNKALEKFKFQIKTVLCDRVANEGGTLTSLIKEAFTAWDHKGTGKLSNWEDILQVANRLNVSITKEDAESLMKSYDRDKTGEMIYGELMKDILGEDPHFLADNSVVQASLYQPSSRCPELVTRAIDRLCSAANIYAQKSKGFLQPRDLLHGTFLKFDTEHSGRISESALVEAAETLKVRFNTEELQKFLTWFDTSGREKFDYNEFIRQVYGEDIMTRKLQLPAFKMKPLKSEKLQPNNASDDVSIASHSSMTSYVSTSKGNSFLSPINTKKSSIESFSGSQKSSPTQSSASLMTMSTTLFKSADWRSEMDDKMTSGLVRNEMNFKIHENPKMKKARAMARKAMMLEERNKVQMKLDSINQQRRAIIEDYKARHPVKQRFKPNPMLK